METEKEPKKKSRRGQWGCGIAILLVIIMIILMYSGLINFPGE